MIEAGAVSVCIIILDGAAYVASTGHVAIGVGELAGEAIVIVHRAAWASVEGHGVGVAFVHAFENIDLAGVRPIGADRPKGWPYTTDPSGHVVKVEDDETVGVGILALEA